MINIQEVSHNRSTVSSNGDSQRVRGAPVRAGIGSRVGTLANVSED
jgi:hypothetical protein